MSQEAPGVTDKRLEERPVTGAGTSARALDQERTFNPKSIRIKQMFFKMQNFAPGGHLSFLRA